MIFIRDIKASFNKINIFFGLCFGVVGIVAPAVFPKYGLALAVFFFALSFFFALYASRLVKHVEAEFKDKIIISDSFLAEHRDKDGNLKGERHSSES